ncbi:hypothetical protein MIND_00998300 [Mycena indigotica]|uniref:Uncharacterized protein n=1 Tax=Mycena indigotica TaxID=2126181 RepID=A0A8H6VUP7_9AGAR|nr:uncharacterized protein MIND_00998300 [Mycena indigotica]KAF7294617.1 hypothetical protein MIND_00998300 [Mycena indigotica]
MTQYVLFGRPLASYILPILLLASTVALFSPPTLQLLASHPATETLASALLTTKQYYLQTQVYLYKVVATLGVFAGIVWVLSPGERPRGASQMGSIGGSGKHKDIRAGAAWKGNPYRFNNCNTCG